MRFCSKRIALCAVVAASGALFVPWSWTPYARAQAPVTTSGQVVQVPVSQFEQIEMELEYLRARDAERQTWEESVARRLPDAGITPASFETMSYTENGAGLPGCDAGLHGCNACQPTCCKPDYCQECVGTSHGCQCPHCLCTPPAPRVCCPRVTTLNPYFNVHVFGALVLDALYNEPRPQAPGTPYFLVPDSPAGFSQDTVDIHARQSTLGADFTGPMIGSLRSGGRVKAMIFNDDVLQDRYGLLPLLAYGELTNDDWRFAAGLQMDVFAPGGPTVLPFSGLNASGNAGNSFRGSLRIERFLGASSDSQVTLQGALSEPVTTIVSPEFEIDEDNGWPNLEGRIAWGLGEPAPIGLLTQRPLEVGVSGVVGQLRRTAPPTEPARRVVSDVWGAAADFRVNVAGFFGFAGEVYTGQGLGTYNGAVLQTLDSVTWEAIGSTGGWLEGFVYLTPWLHSHNGYAIDDPDDDDITGVPNTLFGRTYNSTLYSNMLWDLNESLRIGFEVAYRETEYKDPTTLDNEGLGLHTQFQWSF
jgi:hypothetical protein